MPILYNLEQNKNFLKFIDDDFKKVVFEQKGFNFHNNNEVVSFFFKYLMKFYEIGLFQSPEMFNKIQSFSDDIIHSVSDDSPPYNKLLKARVLAI